MPDKPLVHIVDDDPAVRDSLAFLLETSGLFARTYESAVDFLAAVSESASGCLITDVRMPSINGIELMRQLKAKQIHLPTIVITGHGDIPMAVEAMRAGAVDFIEKPYHDDVILDSIRAALSGAEQQEERDAERSAALERMSQLSLRERQVLEGLVAGHANKVIAFDLGISPRTVEVYRANVMTKMQADSLSDLVRMALLAEPRKT